MEFGATVCTPRSPDCDVCPLAGDCGALQAGTVHLRPAQRRKAKVREVEFRVAVPIRSDEALYLVRRPAEGLLGGLWEFPQTEGAGDPLAPLAEYRLRATGTPVRLDEVPHVFSHLKATYRPLKVAAQGGRDTEDAGWFSPEEVGELALPAAQQAILERVLDG